MIGRKIVIWGATGSGKSTLSRRLGKLLGLPVVELDAIRHAQGWDSTSWDEFRTRLTNELEVCAEGWICDGSYSAISDVYLPQSDTVIWLHLPWRTSFARLVRRTASRACGKQPLYGPDGPRESFRMAFSKKSILWWSISHHRVGVQRVRQRLATVRSDVQVYELRSPAEVESFVARVAS